MQYFVGISIFRPLNIHAYDCIIKPLWNSQHAITMET